MNRFALLFFVGLFLHDVFPAAGQSAPVPKAFTTLIFHKLAPGLTIQDALSVEKEWRAINQAAVSEGNLVGWYMLAKQMTSNPNPTEYDYISVIVSREMAMKGASPAAMAKIYGDSVQARVASLQKRDRATAPVIRMEIWETVDAVFSPDFSPAKTPMIVFDFIRLRDPAADWKPLVSTLKKIQADRVQKSVITGWDFSALVVPKGGEKGYSLVMAQAVPALTVLSESGQGLPDAVRTQVNRTFEVVRQDVFRVMEFTTRP